MREPSNARAELSCCLWLAVCTQHELPAHGIFRTPEKADKHLIANAESQTPQFGDCQDELPSLEVSCTTLVSCPCRTLLWIRGPKISVQSTAGTGNCALHCRGTRLAKKQFAELFRLLRYQRGAVHARYALTKPHYHHWGVSQRRFNAGSE